MYGTVPNLHKSKKGGRGGEAKERSERAVSEARRADRREARRFVAGANKSRERSPAASGDGFVRDMSRERVAKEKCPADVERATNEALGESIGRVEGGWALEGVDRAAGLAPADHGVAHGKPAGTLVHALAVGAVQNSLRVRVEWGGQGRRDADVEFREEHASGKGGLVGLDSLEKLHRSRAVARRFRGR